MAGMFQPSSPTYLAKSTDPTVRGIIGDSVKPATPAPALGTTPPPAFVGYTPDDPRKKMNTLQRAGSSDTILSAPAMYAGKTLGSG